MQHRFQNDQIANYISRLKDKDELNSYILLQCDNLCSMHMDTIHTQTLDMGFLNKGGHGHSIRHDKN